MQDEISCPVYPKGERSGPGQALELFSALGSGGGEIQSSRSERGKQYQEEEVVTAGKDRHPFGGNLKTNKMGFLSGMFSAVVKTVLTPIAVVKDAVNVVTGEEPDATKELIQSAKEDASEAMDDLCEGEL